MNSVQSRLLAATGAVALCFVPVAAQAASPHSAAVHAQGQSQDEAAETAAPEGEGTQDSAVETSSDEAVQTGQGDDADQTGVPNATEGEAEPEANEDGEFGEDGVPADDPNFWEDYLGGEGFMGVQCVTEYGSAPTYELTEAADPGTDWLLIVLASDDEGGIFDIISEPQVGEVFSLENENGSQATLSAVVLCQADLDMSDADPEEVIEDLDGEGNAVTEEAVSAAGPKVETDVPATGGDSGLGAIVGLSALLMGAGGVVASRRWASRN